MVPPDLARAAGALDRRGFLRLAGFATAAGLLPGGCSGLPAVYAPAPDATLAVLGRRAYATFTAVAMRVVGPSGAELIGRRTIDVAAMADGLLAGSPTIAGPFAQGLALLEFGVWPLLPKVRPFTSLDGSAQDAVLADLAASGVTLKRALYDGLRSLVLTTFYASPAARALTGYPGPFGTGTVTIADGMAR
jgi:hypothetical protein